MRVYFDTNVLASALGTRGFCAEVLELVAARHELLLGTPVLAELERVLAERFGLDEPTIRRVLDSFRRFPPTPAPAKPPRKPSSAMAWN
ncbi:MAG: VapC toxin family PIN domain ribonuclease, partial [Acidobacteriota bacterium]